MVSGLGKATRDPNSQSASNILVSLSLRYLPNLMLV